MFFLLKIENNKMEVNDDVADLRDKVALVIYCMFNNDSISHTDWKNIISEMFLQSDGLFSRK